MLEQSDNESEAEAPLDMLEAYFIAHGWPCERHDEEITATVKGSWTEYELRALWREEDGVLQFLTFPDVKVAEPRRAAIHETLALVNEQLWMGHFEMWSSSGILLYRNAMLVDGQDEEEATMSLSAVELLVDSAIDECERFYPVFQFVLWGGKTPQEALAAAMVETQGEA
jgi:hypothetical protein